MRRWPVLLLGAALVFLVSLYLPWQTASSRTDVLNALGRSRSLDGWTLGVGDVAALFALLLAAVAGAALARPNLLGRLPLSLCALLVGYFGPAVAAQARSAAEQREAAVPGVSFHFAYGAYIGVVAAVVALVAGVALRRRDLGRSRSGLARIVLAVGLLVSFLLPWERYFLGLARPPAIVAAALAVCLLSASEDAGAKRFVLGLATTLFTVAAFSVTLFPAAHAYGAWISLGLAIAIAALAAARRPGLPSLQTPRRLSLATGSAAALLVAALFLPWQQACYEKSSDFGPYSGRCVSTNGWTTNLGAAAALLAIGLLLSTVSARRPLARTTLAVGIALLITTFGFELQDLNSNGADLGLGYGAILGFVAAGLLLVLAVVGLRPASFDRKRIPIRLAPIAACIAYLVVIVVPWWRVLPSGTESALRFASESWLTIAGVLLAVWLVQLWIEQMPGASPGAAWLVIVPVAMLALAALDLIRWLDLDLSIIWGQAIVVVLCLLLAVFGWIEQQARLDNVRVPKALRLDRL